MIKKIKKSMKKAGIAVVMTTLASTIIPKAQAEIIFYPLCSASISQLNLDKDFLNNLGDEYSKNIRDWNLRPDWQQPESAKVLNSVGIGADVNLEKILKNIEFLKSCRKNLYFTAGMSICNFNSIYGQGYVFTDPDYKEYSDIIFRDEKNSLSELLAGIKLKKILSNKFEFGASALVKFCYIDGSANLTRTRGTLDSPASYTQWRKAEYEGGNIGFSAQLDLSASLSRLFSVGISMSYNSATVKTKGSEARTSTSAPNPIIKDYNPEYKLDGFRAGISVSYKFGKLKIMGE